MQSPARALYAIAGTLMGFGFIIFGLGLLPLLLGIVLALYGVRRFGPGGLWMVITTAGAVPAIILLYRSLTLDPAQAVIDPNRFVAVAVFVALACAGLAWGLLARRTAQA